MHSDRPGSNLNVSRVVARSVGVIALCLSLVPLASCGGGKEGAGVGSSSAAPSMSAHPVDKVEGGVKATVAKLGVKEAQADSVEALMKLACVVKASRGDQASMTDQVRAEAKERKVPEASEKPEIVVSGATEYLCP